MTWNEDPHREATRGVGPVTGTAGSESRCGRGGRHHFRLKAEGPLDAHTIKEGPHPLLRVLGGTCPSAHTLANPRGRSQTETANCGPSLGELHGSDCACGTARGPAAAPPGRPRGRAGRGGRQRRGALARGVRPGRPGAAPTRWCRVPGPCSSTACRTSRRWSGCWPAGPRRPSPSRASWSRCRWSTTAPTSRTSPHGGTPTSTAWWPGTPRLEFVSAFCGFAPGFAYLSGLTEQYAVPRLDTPAVPGPRRLGRARRHVVRRLPDGVARRLAAARPHRRHPVGPAPQRAGAARARHPGQVRPGMIADRRERRRAHHRPGPRSGRAGAPRRAPGRAAGSAGRRARQPAGRQRPRRRGARGDLGRPRADHRRRRLGGGHRRAGAAPRRRAGRGSDRAEWLPPGGRLRLGSPVAGVRSYLAVAGGIDVAPVLGSRATDTLAWVGPPRVEDGDDAAGRDAGRPASRPGHPATAGARAAPGHAGAARRLVRRRRASSGSARRRTSSARTPTGSASGSRASAPERVRDDELPSEGMVLGAVQVPPGGQPVVLPRRPPADRRLPRARGRPSRDLWQCAQLRPGEQLRFVRGEPSEALITAA